MSCRNLSLSKKLLQKMRARFFSNFLVKWILSEVQKISFVLDGYFLILKKADCNLPPVCQYKVVSGPSVLQSETCFDFPGLQLCEIEIRAVRYKEFI